MKINHLRAPILYPAHNTDGGATRARAEASFRATLTFTDATQRPKSEVHSLHSRIPKPNAGLGAETGNARPRRCGS